jgi:hypothetical protein
MTPNHTQCTMMNLTGAGLVPTHMTTGDTSLEDSKEASLGNSDCTTSTYDVTNKHLELMQPRSATSLYRFSNFFCSFSLVAMHLTWNDSCKIGLIYISLFVSWRFWLHIPHTLCIYVHFATGSLSIIRFSFAPSGGSGSFISNCRSCSGGHCTLETSQEENDFVL